MRATSLSDADIAYIRANFRTLPELCHERAASLDKVRALIRARRLPAPSYLLPDGSEMVPADYFALVDEVGGPERLREQFERRHRAAGGPADEFEADWQCYLDGTYGICLRSVSPEAIVRKGLLVRSIEALLEHEAPNDPVWRSALRAQVAEFDALEREFSPDYDRHRFDRPPSRDRLIAVARDRYPQLFATAAGARGR